MIEESEEIRTLQKEIDTLDRICRFTPPIGSTLASAIIASSFITGAIPTLFAAVVGTTSGAIIKYYSISKRNELKNHLLRMQKEHRINEELANTMLTKLNSIYAESPLIKNSSTPPPPAIKVTE